jgi:leucyl/phenylalanyl-tRNA--protein transferase
MRGLGIEVRRNSHTQPIFPSGKKNCICATFAGVTALIGFLSPEKSSSRRRLLAAQFSSANMSDADFFWLPPDPSDRLGVVALDRHLSAARLISAYRRGIFPWPDASLPGVIPWVCPPRRAILEFHSLHVPKNLRRAQRSLARLRFTIDQAFTAVIHACAIAPRRGQNGTWITPAMVAAYTELHTLGQAHSVEAWDGELLVGGLYGVTAAGVFTGESMFHKITDVSKLCILHLVEHLRSHGATWIDIQQLTPHFALLGAREIPREEFLARLAVEQRAARVLF